MDALSCGRGRAYFGQGDKPEIHSEHGGHGHGYHGKPDPDSLEGLLHMCGHTLHHGNVEGDLFDVLSADEREQLKTLLQKLIKSWG